MKREKSPERRFSISISIGTEYTYNTREKAMLQLPFYRSVAHLTGASNIYDLQF